MKSRKGHPRVLPDPIAPNPDAGAADAHPTGAGAPDSDAEPEPAAAGPEPAGDLSLHGGLQVAVGHLPPTGIRSAPPKNSQFAPREARRPTLGYLETRTETVEPEAPRRTFSTKLADLGDRIARALPPPRRGPEYTFPAHMDHPAAHMDQPAPQLEQPDQQLEESDPYATQEFRIRRIEATVDDDILPRFPVTRQGYDCDAVDAHIAELEDELTDLERQLDEARAQVPSRDAVATQIERVGAQTSAILVAAHDEAQETMRLARTHADTVIADAASYAAALTEEATRTVQDLNVRAASLNDEHGRLLGEIRSTAGALHALADDAEHRSSPAG